MIRSSVHPISDKDLRYLSSLFHLSRMFLYPFFVLAGFLQHFMCFAIHALPHRWSMSGSTGRVLSSNVAGTDKTSFLALFNCRFLSDGCIHLPQVQHTMPTSQCHHGIKFQRRSRTARSTPCYPILVINSCNFSRNGLNSSVLFTSSINESRFG